MALNKSDLLAIDKVVTKRVEPLKKGQTRLEKKIDRLFNFLDRDISAMKKKVASRLGLKVADLSASEN